MPRETVDTGTRAVEAIPGALILTNRPGQWMTIVRPDANSDKPDETTPV